MKSSLPPDWRPSENGLEFARVSGLDDWQTQEQIEQFCDHARATGRKLIDWEAGWRNWIRKYHEFHRSSPRPPLTPREQRREETARVLKQIREYGNRDADDQGHGDEVHDPSHGKLPRAKSG
jgi:hypothetical protein